MSVPSYLIREAFQRLSDVPVRQLVKKAGIDPDLIPGPEPDLDGIRNAYGIQGVPFFVIDSRYGISGAQESATFLAALQQADAERDAVGADAS